MKPLAIDLFCGLGGWTEGLLAEGYGVVGFDIEEHVYDEHRYPGELVLWDVTRLHGSWFKDASLIVASPPCQEYSYMAMPWSLAKTKAAAIRADTTGVKMAHLTMLFNECFRIQREACEAAGRHIPIVVENVRGAQPWVGKAAGKYGSFYLWGDVPTLPATKHVKVPSFRFDGGGRSFQSEAVKVVGLNFSDYGKPGYKAQAFNSTAEKRLRDDIKNNGGSWFNIAHNTTSGKGRNPDGRKQNQNATRDGYPVILPQVVAQGSKSSGRKIASAMIAKIPLPLSRHIARTFKP